MSWTAFSWSRWLEIRSPRFYPWFSYQPGMWPWASHESKSTIKERYNALHMPGALWSYTAFSNTIYYLNLPHSILRGVWQLLTIPVIESRNLRPIDTKSLLNIKCQGQKQTYMMIPSWSLSSFPYTTLPCCSTSKTELSSMEPWAIGGDTILEMWLVPTETYTGYKIQYF